VPTFRSRSLLGLALLAVSLVACGGGDSQAGASGRLQGAVDQVSAHPSDPNTIYAGTPKGFYRSTDRGRQWTVTWQEVYPTGNTADVLAVGVGRRDPSVVYISTDEGVLRSDDSGRTWQPANNGLGEFVVTGFALAQTQPNIAYAATGDPFGSGVYKTTDRGRTWRPAGLGGLFVDAMTIGPQRAILYAAYWDPQLANDPASVMTTSTDGGRTWSTPSPGLITDQVRALVLDRRGASLYAATPQGLFKSIDDAQHWQRRLVGDVTAVAVGLKRLTEVFVATGRTIFRSKDAGRSWSRFATAQSAVRSLSVASTGERLYAGTWRGVVIYELARRR